MKCKNTLLTLLACTCLTVTTGHANSSRQALSDIINAVESHFEPVIRSDAENGIETQVTVGKLDRRLRLNACDEPLRVFTSKTQYSAFRQNVSVSCESMKPWTVHIPVVFEKWATVLTIATPLRRGSIITAAGIDHKKEKLSRLRRGYFTDPSQVVGKIAKRNLRAGSVIKASALSEPKLVQKGEKVIISAAIPGININMYGEALRDGTKGELIKVKNLSSNKTVHAEVIRAGVVEVRL